LNRPDCDSRKIAGEFVRIAWRFIAALAVASLQDLLNLGSEARMNLPGSADANWGWRATEGKLTTSVFQQPRDLIASSNRLHVSETVPARKSHRRILHQSYGGEE